jgi:hypothetical protein
VCSTLPDIDVVGFRFGIRYGDFCGHRAAVLRSELIWIWIPTGLLAVLTPLLRRVLLRVSPKSKNVTDV